VFQVITVFQNKFYFFNRKNFWQSFYLFWPVDFVVCFLSAPYLFVVEFDSADSLILLRGGNVFGTNQLKDIFIDLLR